MPTYRDLWPHVRDDLPEEGPQDRRRPGGEPELPKELEGALHQPLRQLREVLRRRGSRPPRRAARAAASRRRCSSSSATTPTSRSSSSTGSPAGRRRCRRRRRRVARRPATSRSSATSSDGRWTARPNTILVDSAQLESGEAMSAEFKKIAAARDRGVQGRVPRSASPGATPSDSPTRTSCARS